MINGRTIGYQLDIITQRPRTGRNAYVAAVSSTKPQGRPCFYQVTLRQPPAACTICPLLALSKKNIRAHFRGGHGAYMHPLLEALIGWKILQFRDDTDLGVALQSLVPS